MTNHSIEIQLELQRAGISHLAARLEKALGTIETLEADVNNMSALTNGYKETILDRDNKIKELTEQVKKQTRIVQERDEKVKELTARNHSLYEENERLDDEFKETVLERDRRIEELRKELRTKAAPKKKAAQGKSKST